MADSYFLDTSFILRALLDNNEKANAFFYSTLAGAQLPSYTNVVVLSELLNALEKTFFKQDHGDNYNYMVFKNWRKKQEGAYERVSNEYRGIIKILTEYLDIKILDVDPDDHDFEYLLNKKLEYPPLDANDCIHLICSEDSGKIDYIVTCDKDFKDIEEKIPIKVKYIRA